MKRAGCRTQPATHTLVPVAVSPGLDYDRTAAAAGTVVSGKSRTRHTKATNAVDVYIGQRIRTRRAELGVSQSALADQLGLTFQQVQKYEKGLNRVSGAMLFKLSDILDVPMRSFFPPADKEIEEPDELQEIRRGYLKLSNKARTLLLSAVRALVAEEAKPQPRSKRANT